MDINKINESQVIKDIAKGYRNLYYIIEEPRDDNLKNYFMCVRNEKADFVLFTFASKDIEVNVFNEMVLPKIVIEADVYYINRPPLKRTFEIPID